MSDENKPDKQEWEKHKEFIRDMRKKDREERKKAYPLLGTSIEIRPENREAIDIQLGLLQAANQMMLTGAQLKDRYNKELWDLIRLHHPETDGYTLAIAHQSKKVTLTGIEDE